MKIRNIILGTIAVALSAALTGCYEKFNEPAPLHRWTRSELDEAGYRIITIQELRQMFIDNVGQPDDTDTYGKFYLVREKVAIEGRVISNDAYGNFYRSIYIQDPAAQDEDAQAMEDRRGMEIKVGLPSMNLSYPVGSTMFVICEDLAIGNYRKNLSLGLPEAEGSEYANKYIDVRSLIEHHVRRGERANSLIRNDTLVINAANISDWVNSSNQFAPDMSGRLVRFEGAQCTWGTFGTDNNYPSFQNSDYDNVFYTDNFTAWQNYDAGTGAQPANPRPANFYSAPGVSTWAFQEYQGSIRYYGSVRFTVDDCPIIIRTSGYSRFALEVVPNDGDIVDMTGIVNLYTSKDGRFPANQFVINNGADVVIK